MATMNLAAVLVHPLASSNLVEYARIDNVQNPIFQSVYPNPPSGKVKIAENIPAGQYRIRSTPIYPDQRQCPSETRDTAPCANLNSFSARLSGNSIVVSYEAPTGVVKIRITLTYSNGGSLTKNYSNTGNDISIPIPAGMTGTLSIQGQSVCDEDTGWYSNFTQTVSLTIPNVISGQYVYSSQSDLICSQDPLTYYTDGTPQQGSTLYVDSALTTNAVGGKFVLINGTIYNIDPLTGQIGSATNINCNPDAYIDGPKFIEQGTTVAGPGNGYIRGTPGKAFTLRLTASGVVGSTTGGTHEGDFTWVSTGSYQPGDNITHQVTDGQILIPYVMPAWGFMQYVIFYHGLTSGNSNLEQGIMGIAIQ